MKFTCEQSLTILSSQTDFRAELGIIQTAMLLQDNMCEFFKRLDCDGIKMMPINGAFWAMTKSKFVIHKMAKWRDKVVLKTSISKLSPIRIILSNEIISESGEKLVDSIMEVCAIHFETRKLLMIKDTLFPKDIEANINNNSLVFDRPNLNFDDSCFLNTVRINSSNVDYFGHCNNIEYLRLAFAELSCEELSKIRFNSLEVNYLHESRFGDEISFYKKQFDNTISFLVKKSEITTTFLQLGFTTI